MGLEQITSTVWQQIASAGLPSLLMAIAVWWLQKNCSQMVAVLNQERSERLDMMESHVKECEEDRKRINEKVFDLAEKIGELKAANFSLQNKHKNPSNEQ